MVGTSYLRVLYTYREGAMQLTAAKVTSNTFEFLGVMPFLWRSEMGGGCDSAK
jgi:protein involved in ribonucleotide reduction